MVRKLVFSITVALFLGGCVSTQFGMNQLVVTGNIGLEEVDATRGPYRVSVLNTVDFDWDRGNRQDRDKAVQFLLGDQCIKTEILSDVPLPMGSYSFTTKARTKHSLTVRCEGRS